MDLPVPPLPKVLITKNIKITPGYNVKIKSLTSLEQALRPNENVSESDIIEEALRDYFSRPDILDKLLKSAGFIPPKAAPKPLDPYARPDCLPPDDEENDDV